MTTKQFRVERWMADLADDVRDGKITRDGAYELVVKASNAGNWEEMEDLWWMAMALAALRA